jgi:hypothetical protein
MEQPVKPMHLISKKILDVIEGEPFDDLVPAITLILADVGISSGVGAEVFVEFVSNSIRNVFTMKQEHDEIKLH